MSSRSTVPLVARQVLGEELARLRRGRRYNQEAAADVLRCSIRKIQHIESGRVKISHSDLTALLDTYGLTDPDHRQRLLDLREETRDRGWWVKYGKLPQPYADFIGLESAAVNIKVFSQSNLYGLLQTEEFAQACAVSSSGPIDGESVKREVELRMERRARTLTEPGPSFWAILDEGILRRMVGGPKVMMRQLEHLLDVATNSNVMLQVMPFERGGHPGLYGQFAVLDFPPGSRKPVVYVEGQAGNLLLSSGEDVQRCTLAWQIISANAADQSTTLKMIRHAISEFSRFKE